MMRSTDLWLAGFIVSRDWFEEYDLQKLKVKSVEALSDFI
jgi:hypothetical protein